VSQPSAPVHVLAPRFVWRAAWRVGHRRGWCLLRQCALALTLGLVATAGLGAPHSGKAWVLFCLSAALFSLWLLVQTWDEMALFPKITEQDQPDAYAQAIAAFEHQRRARETANHLQQHMPEAPLTTGRRRL
jgi:hypothetical protein